MSSEEEVEISIEKAGVKVGLGYPLWLGFLGIVVVAAVLASSIPVVNSAKAPFLILLCLAIAAAFVFGIVRGRPGRSYVWWMLLAGQLGGLLAVVAWYVDLFAVRSTAGFAAIAEVFLLGAGLLFVGFLLVVARLVEPRSRRGNQVDALIMAVGLGSLWFEWLVWPYYEGHLLSGLLPSVNTLLGLVLIYAMSRVVLARGISTAAKVLVLFSVSGGLAAIGLYDWNGGQGLAGGDNLVLCAWFTAFALQAALVLHPSMASLTRTTESFDDSENRPHVRVIALTLAALIPVYTELIHDLKADGHASDETVIVGAAAVLFVLVALRINDLMVNINEHRRVLAELKVAEQAGAKSLEQIAASEEQYRLVVSGSFDSILILDAAGRVLDCNPACEVMFGFCLAEIRGREAEELLFPPSHERADLLSSSLGYRVEQTGKRADGAEFPIELTVARLQRRQDRLICVTMRDLTDRMMAEQAKRESDAKSRFLSTMSHELRTPLNSIIGFAQLAEPLVANHENPRVPAYMKNILVSGWHLLTLINDVLDLSRVQSGLLQLNSSRVVVQEVVQRAAAKMEPIAHTAGVEISFEVDPELALEVDAVRLEQVLLNLLANAVKFASTRVWLQASPSLSGFAISVRDDGDGIALELQECVFDDFVQLQSGSTRGFDGAGLGLPISRRLVEAMGGTLHLESHPGGGATFTVWLPVESSTAEPARSA
jgi:PAS domain S-box-containing protein